MRSLVAVSTDAPCGEKAAEMTATVPLQRAEALAGLHALQIRRAVQRGGEHAVAVWRENRGNDFIMVPLQRAW